jgi:RNA polymerase sigma factor (sigma-70 family)
VNASAPELEKLVESKKTFLRFLEKRVGNRADAEDILQSAMIEAMEKLDTLREDDRLFAWFYALLRHRIIDRFRRRDAARRAHASAAGRTETVLEPEAELFDTTCRCVNDVLEALKPDQRDLLREVYVDERPVAEVAASIGATRNHAGVKLHRARAALRQALSDVCRACADHGCLDCSCRKGRPL